MPSSPEGASASPRAPALASSSALQLGAPLSAPAPPEPTPGPSSSSISFGHNSNSAPSVATNNGASGAATPHTRRARARAPCPDLTYVFLRKDTFWWTICPDMLTSMLFRKARLTNATLSLETPDSDGETDDAGGAEGAGAGSGGAKSGDEDDEELDDEDEDDDECDEEDEDEEAGAGSTATVSASDGDCSCSESDSDHDNDDDTTAAAKPLTSSTGNRTGYGASAGASPLARATTGREVQGRRRRKHHCRHCPHYRGRATGGFSAKRTTKRTKPSSSSSSTATAASDSGSTDEFRVFRLIFWIFITALAGVLNNITFVKMGLAMPGYPAFLLYFTTLLYVVIYCAWWVLRLRSRRASARAWNRKIGYTDDGLLPLSQLPHPPSSPNAPAGGRGGWYGGVVGAEMQPLLRPPAGGSVAASSSYSSSLSLSSHKSADAASVAAAAAAIGAATAGTGAGDGAGGAGGLQPLASAPVPASASVQTPSPTPAAAAFTPVPVPAPAFARSFGFSPLGIKLSKRGTPLKPRPLPGLGISELLTSRLGAIYVLVGALVTVGGAFSQFSDPHVTGAVQSVINQLTLPLTAGFAAAILGHRFTKLEVIGASIVTAASLLPVIPLVASGGEMGVVGSDGVMNSPFWVFIFLLSDFPSALVNVIEELAFARPYRADEIHYLAFTNLLSLLGYGSLVPLDRLNPGQDPKLAALSTWEIQANAFKCFFNGSGTENLPPACEPNAWMPVIGFVLCIVVYFYVAAVVVKHESAAFQALANTLVTPVSAIAFSSVLLMGRHAQQLDAGTVAAIVLIPAGIVVYKWEDFSGGRGKDEDILPLIARH